MPAERKHSQECALDWHGKDEAARRSSEAPDGRLVALASESIDFGTTSNLFIEGENLESLKLLRPSYGARVRVVYIDPPYNIDGEFLYEDSRVSPRRVPADSRLPAPWLSMLYARLLAALPLLDEAGCAFVSIHDAGVAHLRLLMDEVFGPENFVAQLTWQKIPRDSGPAEAGVIPQGYIVCYAKDASRWRRARAGAGPWPILDGPYSLEGRAELDRVLGRRIEILAKPVGLLQRLLDIDSTDDAVVLDFFAGTCVTAEAVLRSNRRDGGARRFVMIQIAEPFAAESAAFKAGFPTMADLGRERIRRVIAELKGASPAGAVPRGREDLGLRVCRLAER